MSPAKKRTVINVVDPVAEQIKKRNQLADLLTMAAQLEHDVMVQYLFAAFSLKKTVSEGGVNYAQLELMRSWATSMLLVARQEMEHLGYVSNLLTAIGEAPVFRRPAIPDDGNAFSIKNFKSSLDKFSLDTVFRFLCYEIPNEVDKTTLAYLRGIDPGFKPSDYDGIYTTYKQIEKLFEEIKDIDLFIGPPSAQFLTGGNSVLARGRIFPKKNTGKPTTIYDLTMMPVTNLYTAKKVIQQIVEEGEGVGKIIPGTEPHFVRFLNMHMELNKALQSDPNFEPARAVVSNPFVSDANETNLPDNGITNANTKQVMETFDQAYNTMLLMLMRFFANTDETEEDLLGLQGTAFFPMMTLGIRPLAEVLTQLPAHEATNPLRAGPSFIIHKAIQFLPHRTAAWQVMLGELQLLASMAKGLTEVKTFPPPIQTRLQFIYENFDRMTMNFQNAMHVRKMQ